MNKSLSIKIFIFITFFIPIAYYLANYFYDLSEIIFQVLNTITNFIFNYKLISILLFSISVFLMVLANFPGGSLRAIMAGYFFGNEIGVIIIIMSTTTAAFILFLFYKKNISITFQNKKFINLVSKFDLKKDFNFLSLRLLPVIPFFIQNIAAAQFKIKNSKFILITIFGILPINFLYATFGSQLNSIKEISSFENLYHIYDFKYLLFILLSILAYFLLIKLNYKIFNK